MFLFNVHESLNDITIKYDIKTEMLEWLATVKRVIGMDEEWT